MDNLSQNVRKTRFSIKKKEKSCLYECKYATDGHIGINNFAKERQGKTLVNLCTERKTENDATNTAEPAIPYRFSQKALTRPENGHKNITNEEIALHHRHVFFFCLAGSYKKENGRRTLHPEEAAHEAGYGAHSYLNREGRLEFNALADKKEIDTDENENNSEDVFQ